MVEGVAENNLNGLQSSTITVNNTIDLKGTGLTGFTQDRAGDSQVFSGTLNGGGTIKLAVGEPYGMRGNAPLGANDTSAGNGKISPPRTSWPVRSNQRHDRQQRDCLQRHHRWLHEVR